MVTPIKELLNWLKELLDWLHRSLSVPFDTTVQFVKIVYVI